MKTMRYISLFSGIEAASVAWGPLGWEPVAFSEIEPFPCAVLAERFPDVPNLGDITEIDWSSYVGSVDVVVGGSPCQSFSVAGKREGLAGESGLMFEYIRAVRELMPKYFVWENVPGALSSEGGAAFGQLLREMDGIGYGMAWRVLDAQFFGVAQRRRRVFLVGCLGDAKRAAEILFERESMRWDHPSSRAKREELAGAAKLDSDGSRVRLTQYTLAFDTTQITSPTNGNNPQFGDPCHPLCAAAHVPAIAFKYHAGAKAGSAAVCDDRSTPTLTADYHQPSVLLSDNTPCVCMTQYGSEIAGTLTARHDSSPCADRGQNVVCFAQNTRDEVRLVGGDGSMTGALCANPGAKQQNYVMQAADIDHGAVWRWPWIVRRLTPRECERLQGFPDDFTRIPYRGKPAEECPDTPRYKAIGNSMAVPVMRWIGERIAMVDAFGGPI